MEMLSSFRGDQHEFCLVIVDILWTFMEHIGLVVRMSVSGYRRRLFKSRHRYVVSLSRTFYLHCFSRLICEMSTRWRDPREGCSVL